MTTKKSAFVIMVICVALLSVCLTACNDNTDSVCEHVIVAVKQSDASCTQSGRFAHYKCTKCGDLFSDFDGKTPISEDRIIIAELPHTALLQSESVGTYKNFYYCNSCGKYFEDKNGTKEIPYSELTDDSVSPSALSSLSNYGNVFVTKTLDASSPFEDISGDFTIRMFVGWTGPDGKTMTDFPSSAKIHTYYNLNRTETLQGTGWYNFGVGYSKSTGIIYKGLQTGTVTSAPAEFTALFLEQGGLYVRIVRSGAAVSFYFEDKFGKPRFMQSNNEFGSDGTLIRFAANKAEGAEGWTPFVKNAAICIGIGNPRCVFDNETI